MWVDNALHQKAWSSRQYLSHSTDFSWLISLWALFKPLNPQTGHVLSFLIILSMPLRIGIVFPQTRKFTSDANIARSFYSSQGRQTSFQDHNSDLIEQLQASTTGLATLEVRSISIPVKYCSDIPRRWKHSTFVTSRRAGLVVCLLVGEMLYLSLLLPWTQ